MNILQTDFVKEFMRFSEDGFRFGWHEHNGGNLSYRMKPEDVRQVKDSLSVEKKWQNIEADVPGLGDEYFLITGTGKHFRNIAANPADNIGIINIDEDGERYRVCWGLTDAGPTSELPTHLMNHDVKKHMPEGSHRVIYHCHPPNLMALTFVLPLESEHFTRLLWQTLTECSVAAPKGVGVLDWMLPGGVDIATASSELLKERDAVIWAYHGLFVSGENFETAFGLAHTIEKSAEIAVKINSMGGRKQGITADNLKALSSAFNLNLKIDPSSC
jgi:rhamnulose-1-phosphate aldolase